MKRLFFAGIAVLALTATAHAQQYVDPDGPPPSLEISHKGDAHSLLKMVLKTTNNGDRYIMQNVWRCEYFNKGPQTISETIYTGRIKPRSTIIEEAVSAVYEIGDRPVCKLLWSEVLKRGLSEERIRELEVYWDQKTEHGR
jgi:hypothetical protein